MEDLLTVLEFFLVVIRYVRLKRLPNSIHDDADTLGVLTVVNAYSQDLLTYFKVIMHYAKLHEWKKKRRLTKPHYLITLLNGYKVNLNNKDVWRNME